MFENKKVVTIYSGNFYISDDPEVVIYTLLGSCVAVCLYDDQKGIGGMNHFMLPQQEPHSNGSKPGWFGLDSLELMLERILKAGGSLANLKAKVFGGARVVENIDVFNFDVAAANINFTIDYLQNKKIPIISKDVGGTTGRKVYYCLKDHCVLVQRLDKELKSDD